MEVLISPGYGSGFSTWNDEEMAIDPRLIEKFKTNPTSDEFKDFCNRCGYNVPYMGGFDDLIIVEVPKGYYFRVREYDGNESIEFFNPKDWFYSGE